jgi:hypothetical protein
MLDDTPFEVRNINVDDCVVPDRVKMYLYGFGAWFPSTIIVTPHACAKDKAIGSVCPFVCLSVSTKSPNLDIYASERLVSTTNSSKSLKKPLHYASNRLVRPTSIANTAFLLATPIDFTHCRPASCAQSRTIRTCR